MIASLGTHPGFYEYSIATDGDDIFFYNPTDGNIASVPVCGGVVQSLFALPNASSSILLDAHNIYILDTSSPVIDRCAKTGCGGTPSALNANNIAGYYGLTIDGNSNLYWYTQYGNVSTMPGSGGTPVELFAANTKTAPTGNIAADTSNFYFQNPQGLVKCSVSGCTTPTLVSADFGGNSYLAIDDQNIYGASPGGVSLCAKSGCTTSTGLANGTNIQGLVTDGVNVYWTDSNGTDGWIMKCSVTGCGQSPTEIATFQDTPEALAVDATSVYWTNLSGNIMRANK